MALITHSYQLMAPVTLELYTAHRGQVVPKSIAYVVGERLVRPAIEYAASAASRSVRLVTDGLSAIHRAVCAVNILPVANAEKPDAILAEIRMKLEASGNNIKLSDFIKEHIERFDDPKLFEEIESYKKSKKEPAPAFYTFFWGSSSDQPTQKIKTFHKTLDALLKNKKYIPLLQKSSIARSYAASTLASKLGIDSSYEKIKEVLELSVNDNAWQSFRNLLETFEEYLDDAASLDSLKMKLSGFRAALLEISF